MKSHKKFHSAFTIVELLIVVVVIAILAVITVVAYSGISNSAVESSLMSDIRDMSKKLELSKVQNGVYPDTLSGIDENNRSIFSYTLDGDSYCLAVTSASKPSMKFYLRDGGGISPGLCPIWPVAVAVGGSHACAIASNNDIYCWGRNNLGQLGDGTNNNSSTPVAVSRGAIPQGVTIQSISAGNDHTCVVGSNGRVYCWGGNGSNQIGDGTRADRLVPVVTHTITGVKQVSSGFSHSCAVTYSGLAYCWGDNFKGQLGDGTSRVDRSRPVAVLRGAMPASDQFEFIVAVGSRSCAVSSSKKAYCWGDNYEGRLGTGTDGDRLTPTAVSRGSIPVGATIESLTSYCVLTSNEKTYCWGSNEYGQLGNGSNTTYTYTSPTAVAGGSTPEGVIFESIYSGSSSSCAIASNREVYCWGVNSNGQLGDGTTSHRNVPILAQRGVIPADVNIESLSIGSGAVCAIASDKNAYCWGYNVYGGLGNDTTTNSPLPVLLHPLQ